ncbi:MAG: hypothetical protein FJX45_12980 [Alphaproteobacteria bacterium]|nr:hypothetical protein [Alphaproteobacteria bacterium]MBM3652506.1 hypothetical protein [Alphaproteobacteria bacterium]
MMNLRAVIFVFGIGVAVLGTAVSKAQRGTPGASEGSEGVVANPNENVSPLPADDCNAEAGQYAVGMRATPALLDELKAKTRATVVRVLREGQPVTREYRFGRLNVIVDRSQRIVRIYCG